jgi:hypothetical protein
MLLATFQPTARTKAKIIAEQGETIQPLWCFSAETFVVIIFRNCCW